MIIPANRDMTEALQDELVSGRKYLLMFDDADRYLDEIAPLISFCKDSTHTTKIILTSNTSGRQLIYDRIIQMRCEEIFYEIYIADWSNDELIQLLRLVARQDKVKDEDLIVTQYPNPYLITYIGKKIINEPVLDFGKIKEKFINEINFQAEVCLKDIFSKAQSKEFIFILALLVPFSKGNKELLIFISSYFNLNLNRLEEAIINLEKAGILRTIGNSLRFNPDMKGDLYLGKFLETTENFNAIEKTIKTLWVLSAEHIFMNLEAAARYSDTSSVKSIISREISDWIINTETTNGFIKRKRLNFLKFLCNFNPEGAINLLYTYLEGIKISSNGISEILELSTDDFGPIILKLMKSPSLGRELLKLLEKLAIKKIKGRYVTYHPDSIIKELVSPIFNDSTSIKNILNGLREWLIEPNTIRIELISAALSELLAGSLESSRYAIGKLMWREVPIPNTPEIIEIRNEGLIIINDMLNHSSLEVQLAGIQITDNIGETVTRSIEEANLPLSKNISEERLQVIEKLGELISPKTNFRLLNAIQNLFLSWWAHEKPGTDKATDFLRIFPQSIEFIVFKHFISPEYLIEDFNLIEKQAHERGKWSWFVHKFMSRYDSLYPQDFQELVTPLSKKYKNQEDLVHFLKDLDEEIKDIRSYNFPLVNSWVKLNPDLFLSIRNDIEIWKQIPQRFKNEIDIALSDQITGDNLLAFMKKLGEEIMGQFPEVSNLKLEGFLKILTKNPIERSFLEFWLSYLLKNGNSEIQSMVIHHLLFICKKLEDFNLCFKLLNEIVLIKKDVSKGILDELYFLVVNKKIWIEFLNKDVLERFREKLLDILKNLQEIDFQSQHLLDFTLDNLDMILNFIESRVQIYKLKRNSAEMDTFQAIPIEGLDCIKNKIISYSDFEKLFEKIIIWFNQDDTWRLYYLQYLMNSIVIVLNPNTGKSYLNEFIQNRLTLDEIDDVIIAAHFLPFNEDNLQLIIEIAERSIQTGKQDDIKELLTKRVDSIFIQGIVGESRPILTSLKDLFTKMYIKSHPGVLRTIIKRCIDSIDKQVEEIRKDDMEFLNPKM